MYISIHLMNAQFPMFYKFRHATLKLYFSDLSEEHSHQDIRPMKKRYESHKVPDYCWKRQNIRFNLNIDDCIIMLLN